MESDKRLELITRKQECKKKSTHMKPCYRSKKEESLKKNTVKKKVRFKKKERNHALDQESDQEKTITVKKIRA